MTRADLEEGEGDKGEDSKEYGKERGQASPLQWAEGRTGGKLPDEEGGKWPPGLLSCSSKDLCDMWVESDNRARPSL